MKYLFRRIFFVNWPRKLVAFISAIVIWFLVGQTITMTRTLPDVGVRIINLPADKTVVGLLPNGLLNKKIAVTLTGSKSVVESLTPRDIEIVINAEGKKASWVESVDKKTLGDLSPEWDLKKHITQLDGGDLFIKLSKLITAEIPVKITNPVGEPPKGYRFLDVWPKLLVQRVSGPEEQVLSLQKRGLELTFNLTKVSEADLEAIQDFQTNRVTEEISFFVPPEWKQVTIPFRDYALEPLNDPRAKFLRLDFLKQELIPIGIQLPIEIFYPLKYSETINPDTYTLAPSPLIEEKNGLKLLTTPLYAREVGRLFLESVKDNMQLTIIAVPEEVQEELNWTVEFVNLDALEKAYVKAALKKEDEKEDDAQKSGEDHFRSLFHRYIRNFTLFTKEDEPLELQATLKDNTILFS